MPDPLNYHNPQSSDCDPPKRNVETTKLIPVPKEFNRLLTRTQDASAVHAIEAQLRRDGVEVFRRDDGLPAQRWTELHIRASDELKASQIAGRIFARRAKMRSFPRQEVKPSRGPGESDGIDIR